MQSHVKQMLFYFEKKYNYEDESSHIRTNPVFFSRKNHDQVLIKSVPNSGCLHGGKRKDNPTYNWGKYSYIMEGIITFLAKTEMF